LVLVLAAFVGYVQGRKLEITSMRTRWLLCSYNAGLA